MPAHRDIFLDEVIPEMEKETSTVMIRNGSTNNDADMSTSSPPSLTGSPPQIKTVSLRRTGPDGLGFSIVGGFGKSFFF